ncbi:MAG: hypothetical protein H7X93_14055, partial [Sphingomonadaceae bacterium]|nr:hypothetical protein [Sphingomonadaceae bacterium]
EGEAADARERSGERAEREALERREEMRQTIAEERETGMAIAALLLVIGALSGGGGLVLFAYRAGIRHGMYLASAAWGVGGVLLIAAVTVFVTRPTMSDLAERLGDDDQPASTVTTGYDPAGANQCELDGELSRITVTQPEPLRFNWGGDGCQNGGAQFAEAEDGVWQRPFVAGDEPVVRVESFDTNRGEYTVQRYQISAAQLAEARRIRARYREASCEAGDGRAIGDLHREIAELLPRAPNEHLTYQCRKVGAE